MGICVCACVCKVILLLASTRDIRYQRSELSEEPWLYVARWAYVCVCKVILLVASTRDIKLITLVFIGRWYLYLLFTAPYYIRSGADISDTSYCVPKTDKPHEFVVFIKPGKLYIIVKYNMKGLEPE